MSLMDRMAGREESQLASVTTLPLPPELEPFRREIPAYSKDRPLTAAAERINLKQRNLGAVMGVTPWRAWQDDSWDYYDAIGEVKYAFTVTGSVFSRLRIYPAIVIDPDAPPASTTLLRRRAADRNATEKAHDVAEDLSPPPDISDEMMTYMERLVANLGNGKGGIPGLLRQFALNIAVAGECYLCQIDKKWSVRSTQEVTVRGSDGAPMLRTMRTTGQRADGTAGEVPLPKGTYVARIWRQHPRYSGEPDSSMLGLRDSCDELLTLQRMIRATARSKMNAGLLLIPDSITSAGSTITEGIDGEEQDADAFEQELMQQLVEPVTDESSLATVMPMVGRGPAEDIDKVKYVTFSRDADGRLVERADRTLERILQGIDVPKDIVTGLANVKYSNAVVIDESLYKSHIEPMALLLVDALTQVYLRQGMRAKFPGILSSTLEKIVIWYDPTEVVTKPDAATAAETLYDKYELSGDALRRSHGFADTDAPSEDEVANRLALATAAVMPPDVVTALVKHLVPQIFKEMQASAADASGMPQDARDLLGISNGQQPTPAPADQSQQPSLDDSGAALSPGTDVAGLTPDQMSQVPPGVIGG